MHTWKTKDNKQHVWDKIIENEIDYSEYELLNPDFYTIDEQEDFIENIDMSNYFYKNIWDKYGDNKNNGEWWPSLIKNHLCALESMKRGLEMVENFIIQGNSFKYIMFVRPDILIYDDLPVDNILINNDKITIPRNNHYEGYNDRFAIMNYSNSCIYGKRINELVEFRKNNGRIVSEKYVKFIIDKYNIPVNMVEFKFEIIRP